MGTHDSDGSSTDSEPSENETTETIGSRRIPRNGSTSESTAQSSSDETADSGKRRVRSLSRTPLLEFEQDGLIRDRSLLDPNYVVERAESSVATNETEEVTKMLRVALGDNRPPNLFLYGPSGTGKSLITKSRLQEHQSNL